MFLTWYPIAFELVFFMNLTVYYIWLSLFEHDSILYLTRFSHELDSELFLTSTWTWEHIVFNKSFFMNLIVHCIWLGHIINFLVFYRLLFETSGIWVHFFFWTFFSFISIIKLWVQVVTVHMYNLLIIKDSTILYLFSV